MQSFHNNPCNNFSTILFGKITTCNVVSSNVANVAIGE